MKSLKELFRIGKGPSSSHTMGPQYAAKLFLERNAFAAARALDSNIFASFSEGIHRVSFDKVINVMKQTGHDLPSLYKETSEGGLAAMNV